MTNDFDHNTLSANKLGSDNDIFDTGRHISTSHQIILSSLILEASLLAFNNSSHHSTYSRIGLSASM